MGKAQTLRVWFYACVLPYVAISMAIFAIRDSEGVGSALAGFGGYLWLAGPPVLLLANLSDSWLVCGVGTSAVLLTSLLAVNGARRGAESAVAFGAVTLLIWLSFGLLIYLAV